MPLRRWSRTQTSCTRASSNSTISPTLVTTDPWSSDRITQGVVTGTTYLFVDPVFVDAESGDYHLAGTSPLINAGATVPWLTMDFEGDPRPTGPAYDIGADEFVRRVYVPLVMRAFGS